MNNEIRLLHLARQFAEIHICDSDILGKMAQELLILIDKLNPGIRELPLEEE